VKTPQPLLLERGEALIWLTDGGNSINPYVPEDQRWKLGGFTQDGWGFGIVTEAGHHYQVLAYYAVQVLKWRREERPTPALAVHCPRSPYLYGTIDTLRLTRARVERLGRVPDEALTTAGAGRSAPTITPGRAQGHRALARVRPGRLEYMGGPEIRFPCAVGYPA
jgi:hypothetical protein